MSYFDFKFDDFFLEIFPPFVFSFFFRLLSTFLLKKNITTFDTEVMKTYTYLKCNFSSFLTLLLHLKTLHFHLLTMIMNRILFLKKSFSLIFTLCYHQTCENNENENIRKLSHIRELTFPIPTFPSSIQQTQIIIHHPIY